MTETANAAPPRQNKARKILGGILLLVAALIGWRIWWSSGHIGTDNAQVEGHIVPVSARVGGYVLRVPNEDNSQVARGQLLVEIDPRDYIARVAQAEADWRNALSASGQSGQPGEALAKIGAANAAAAAAAAQGQAAETAIAEARATATKARNDLQRARELAAQKMYSQAQLDTAQTALAVAEARVQSLIAQKNAAQEQAAAARQQVVVSGAGLKSAEAKTMAAEAALALARHQLADTQVTAPASGVVSKRAVEPGQMIQAGQTLMYLVDTSRLWVTANLKETEIAEVKPGQRAEIRVDALSGVKLTGKVKSFSPATGARFTLLPPDNATGNFTKVVQRVPVRIALDPLPEGVTLRPGLSVDVTILTR
ncbi:HlyD family secretion protein [Chitinilyticum piscinae]|uniref:HlyD family secretion protein n=1 Tax=Chitinilyticum piscinae TaxID=2866724 RepID=A0A8J7FYY6_9NEIS|nr:HlyD family secretion protein [Chitinilyticum piscinae]MBE9608258.1 HlyD family secretion protein [Chitinilyticum piscinae]